MRRLGRAAISGFAPADNSALIPFAEAAEQTVLQRVVPLAKQGRVFGLAQSVEVAAAPLTAFAIGPIAEFWLIPYMDSEAGRLRFGPLLGDGDARGIALVFLLAGAFGIAVTIFARLDDWKRGQR